MMLFLYYKVNFDERIFSPITFVFSVGYRAESAFVQTQGAALNVWAMGIVNMSVKAQTEVRRALNAAKMATKMLDGM